jgi:hypothetical protein
MIRAPVRGGIMGYANQHEIEYLGSLAGESAGDRQLIDEMQRRLDALRRNDQNFSNSDRRPRAANAGWRPDSPIRMA